MVVACRAAASRVGADEAFAQGVLAAAANFAAFAAKSLAAPVADAYDVRAALAGLVAVQAFSALAATTLRRDAPPPPPPPQVRATSSTPRCCAVSRGCGFLGSERFWLVVGSRVRTWARLDRPVSLR